MSWRLQTLLAAALSAALVACGVSGAQTPPEQKSSPVPQAELAQVSGEAQQALRQGDYAGAIQGFEKLVKLAPGIAESHANLGMAYYSAGRYRQAVAPCRKALKLKPSLTAAHYFLGLSLAESGQCKEALPYLGKDYARVTDRRLKHVIGTDGVRCAMVLDQADKAVDFVRLLNRDFPDDPDTLYLSTHVYSDLSTRASQRLLHTAPGSYQTHQFNAEVLEIQGKVDDAVAEYRKVLSLNPRLPGIHFRIGRLLLTRAPDPKALEQARQEFEEELRLDPDNAAAEYELGEMARQARQWNAAIEHFRRAANLEPEFADALIGLGRSLVSAGRAEEAVAPLQRAVKLRPDNPVAHYQLSFAYRRVGRDEEATKELALYQEIHDKLLRTSLAIRKGILGDLTRPQTAEPPE